MVSMADYDAWKLKEEQSGVGAASVVLSATDVKPDEAAGDMRLASEYGKTTGNPTPPLPLVREYRNVFQAEIERQKNSTILSTAPRLTEWLRNPDNAAIARDSLENLSWWETTLGAGKNAFKRGAERIPQAYNQFLANSAAERAQDQPRSFGDILSDETAIRGRDGSVVGNKFVGPQDLFAAGSRFLTSRMSGMLGWDNQQRAAYFQQQVGAINKRIAEIPMSPAGSAARDQWMAVKPSGDVMADLGSYMRVIGDNPAGFAAFAVETAAESAPAMAAALGVTAATRNPAAGAVFMGLNSAVTEKGSAPSDFFSEQGIDISTPDGAMKAVSDPELMRKAIERGNARGLVIGLMDGLSGGVAGTMLAKSHGGNLILQAVTQALMGAAGEAGGQIAAGQQINIGDILLEGIAEFAGTPVEVAAMGGGRAMRAVREARDAKDRKAVFEAISGQAQGSALRERVPEKFREFVEAATKDGPVENVYVPAKEFIEYFQSFGVDPFELVDTFEGVTRDDLGVALAGGGDLRIPTATYAARIAGSEHDAFLMENMRFDPDHMTAREAADFQDHIEQLQQEAWEAAEAAREEAERFRPVEERVYDRIVHELRAAGRSTEVATTEALPFQAFYRTMAERSGMTPEEFVDRYVVPRVEGAIPEGMQLRNTDELTRTLAEARARKSVGDKRQTLLEFISEYGGIHDPGGELKARNAETISRGKGKKTLRLARKGLIAGVRDMLGGSSDGKRFGVDDIASAAVAAGYLHDDPAVMQHIASQNEGGEAVDITGALWDAIDRELRGEAQYSVHDAADPAIARGEYLDKVEEYLNSIGVSLDDSDATIREAMQDAETRHYAQRKNATKNLIVQHNLTAANLLHADKMRGLAVPSLAISNVEYPLDGFGEITLLGASDLIDPRRDKASKVFDADVYSPRYPTVRYKLSKSDMSKAWKRLGNVSTDLGHVLSSELDHGEVERKGLEAFRDSSAVQLQFLRDTGRDVALPKKSARSDYLKMVPELATMRVDTYSVAHEPEVKAAVEKAIDLSVQKTHDAAPDIPVDELRDMYYLRGEVRRSVIDDIRNEIAVASNPGVDQYAARNAIRDAVKPHANEFAAWVDKEFSGVLAGETIQTETASGDWRYLPHTLDNVVKVLRKKLRDGEGFNYGVGSIRSTVANQFKSVSAIEKARDRLIPSDAMQAVKDEIDSEFAALAGKLGEYSPYSNGFGWLDTFSEQLKEVADRGIRSLNQYFNDLPPELAQEAGAFLTKLSNLPTEYFEAKLQRAVSISEFKAAVIPSDTSKEARDVLEAAGVPVFEYARGSEGARAAAIRMAASEGRLLFQSGADRGGRSAPVQIDPETSVPVLELSGLPSFTSAEAMDALKRHAGEYTTASGETVSITAKATRKALSKNANATKRGLVESFGSILENSVVYSRVGDFSYAVAHLRLDGRDIAVRSAIREIADGTKRLYQLEGFDVAGGEGEKRQTISTPFPDDSRARSASDAPHTVADLVSAFNDLPAGTFPLFHGNDVPRGSIQFPAGGVTQGQAIVRLMETANLSTFTHEAGHFYLEVLKDMAANGLGNAAEDFAIVNDWWRANAADVAKDANKAGGSGVTAEDVIAALDSGTTGDKAKDIAINTGMHEQWARAMEAYFLEGKAPSVELRSAFEKMRAWLISIYRAVLALNVNVSDELRGVFDRMLASDEQIAQAQERAGGNAPVFATAEQMGLTQEEFDRLMKLRDQAEVDAKGRLLKEAMEPIRREREKWFKEERAKVREEVEREINGLRMFRALEWMGNRRWLGEGKPEDMPDIRLSKDALVEMYGEGVLKTLRRGKQTVYTVDGGMHPDEAAGWFGFGSGDELVKALEQAPNRIESIEAETDKVMYERHGDVLNDGSIEEAALDAVHSDKRGQWIAAELKAIADVAGVDVGLTAKEARATARDTVSRMRVRDALAANRFLAAERKAANEAAQLGATLAREGVWLQNAKRRLVSQARKAAAGKVAPDAVAGAIENFNARFETVQSTHTVGEQARVSKSGKAFTIPGGERTTVSLGYNDLVAKLIDAKRRQLLNHALYNEARAVADEVGKAERYVKSLGTASKRQRIAGAGRRENAQIDYLGAIDELLDRYDFRKMSGAAEQRRGSLLAFVEAMKLAGRENELAIPDDVLANAIRTPYKTIPVDELRGVIDSLKNLEHVALRWDDLIDEQRKRKLDAVAEGIREEIAKNLPARPPGPLKTKGERVRGAVRAYFDTVLNATTLLREIDGFKDDGVAYREIKAPIDEAQNRLIVRKRDAATKLEALYSVYSKEERRAMATRQFVPELGYAISKWEKIALALNTGNAGNVERLMSKRARRSFTEEQITAVLKSLDERDADFIQSVWDYIGSFKADIAARERRVTGVEPKWVEAQPVVIGGKELRGGYYPIKYDTRLSSAIADREAVDVAQSLVAGKFGKAQTKNGHTKARAQGSSGSIDLDMIVMHNHINQVIYDLEMSEPVANAWRILQDGRVRTALDDAGRSADFDALQSWLKDSAEGELGPNGAVGAMLRGMKSNFTAAKLAFNLSNALLQVAGLAQSFVVVGKKDMAVGIMKTARNPFEAAQRVADASPFMASRQTTFNKDVMDFYADPRHGQGASRWADFKRDFWGPASFWLMQKTQWYFADVPTWIAGYEQGLRKFGNDEAKAVAHADSLVKRAQASGLFIDRTGIERGSLTSRNRQNDLVKLFSTLGSYMFAKFNAAYERSAVAARTVQEEGVSFRSAQEVASWSLDMAFLFTLEALVMGAVRGKLPGGDDGDDEGWLEFLAKETAFSALGTLPFIRDGVSALQGFSGGGAYGSLIEDTAKGITSAAKITGAVSGLTDEEVKAGDVKRVINATGVATGVPTVFLNRIVDAGWRASEGEDVSPLEYIVGRMGRGK